MVVLEDSSRVNKLENKLPRSFENPGGRNMLCGLEMTCNPPHGSSQNRRDASERWNKPRRQRPSKVVETLVFCGFAQTDTGDSVSRPTYAQSIDDPAVQGTNQ